MRTENLKLDAYALRRRRKNGYSFIELSSRAGHWALQWGEDNETFRAIDSLLSEKTEEVEDYLHGVFAMFFQVTNIMPDGELIRDWCDAIARYTERRMEILPEISDDELQEMIALEKTRELDLDELYSDALAELEDAKAQMTAQRLSRDMPSSGSGSDTEEALR